MYESCVKPIVNGNCFKEVVNSEPTPDLFPNLNQEVYAPFVLKF